MNLIFYTSLGNAFSQQGQQEQQEEEFGVWFKSFKRRKLFSTSDLWSPVAGFFPIGTHKLTR